MDEFTKRVAEGSAVGRVGILSSDEVERKYILDLEPIDAAQPTGIDATLAERGSRYGDFAVHAEIAQQLQADMRDTAGWARLDATKRQALTVIADKIARILSGDPEYADNWHDIQGYAKLVEDRL